MTFEERKQAIIANGIVEDVTVQCAWMPKDFGRVSHPSEWQFIPSYNGALDVFCKRSQCFLYDADNDRYATVITPAPAEPSEVDRLRARVEELEGAANDFTKKVIAAFPLLDSENPKQVDVYMSLHELQAILNKTTNTPDQQ